MPMLELRAGAKDTPIADALLATYKAGDAPTMASYTRGILPQNRSPQVSQGAREYHSATAAGAMASSVERGVAAALWPRLRLLSRGFAACHL